MLTLTAWALFSRYWFVRVVQKSQGTNGSDTKYRAFIMSILKYKPSKTLSYMKEFVIIAGTQNSGKTTTAWCVYQRLLP